MTKFPPLSTQSRLQRVLLTGFMGAGKSTIGRLLAQSTGWTFLDLDVHLEQTTGTTARELFANLGETGFRDLESKIFAETLSRSHTIIAPGGAVIDRSENQVALKNSRDSFTVFLDGPFDVLIARCVKQEQAGQSTYRPLLQQEAMARVRYDARRVLYASHAQLKVDVADATPQEIQQTILIAISEFHSA